MSTTEKQPIVVTAKLWDGSQQQAGEIIEWVEEHEGVAIFRETNETTHKKHSEIRLQTRDGIMLSTPPNWWIVKAGKDSFFPCSQEFFDELG